MSGRMSIGTVAVTAGGHAGRKGAVQSVAVALVQASGRKTSEAEGRE